MKKLSNIFKVLYMKKWWQEPEIACRRNGIASFVLSCAALIMLIMNIKNHSTDMTLCSVVLVVGFLLSTFCALVWKKPNVSSAIIVILVALILSIFAIRAGNEGFAILWILLVPFFAVGLLGIKSGIILCIYFMVFLFMLFYGPMNHLIIGKYPDSYMSRFPVLYMCDAIISVFLAVQAEYYDRLAHIRAYEDELTGLYSRHYFMEKMQKISLKEVKDMTLVVLDINGLKVTNDTFGHHAGDELIMAFVKCSQKVFKEKAILSRIGGDEFAYILFMPDDLVEEKLDLLKDECASWKGKNIKGVYFSSGCASKEEYPECDMRELLKIADHAMYEDKEKYYENQCS